jgi:hypothetical protein
MTKLTAGIAALAVLGFTGSAMAQTLPPTGQVNNSTYGVGVNITVAPEVSMWAAHQNVALTMNGQDANNSATFASGISHINNVAANISATTTGNLPAPIVSGGGINFFIFYNEASTATAVNAITANAYNPAGAAVWNHGNLGSTAQLGAVPVATSIANVPVVYASASPGELPLPNSYSLVVTYQITAQ